MLPGGQVGHYVNCDLRFFDLHVLGKVREHILLSDGDYS